MARRKAEVVETAAEAPARVPLAVRMVEAQAEQASADDERLHSIELTLNAVPLVTPEAGVRILHQAMADLVALIREVNSR